MTGVGHEDAFPRPRLSARCRFSQGTFAGIQGNGRVPDLPTLTPEGEVRARTATQHSRGIDRREHSGSRIGSDPRMKSTTMARRH